MTYDELYQNNPAYTKDQWGTYRDQSGGIMYDNAGAQPGRPAVMNHGDLAGINFNGGGHVDPAQGVYQNTDTAANGFGISGAPGSLSGGQAGSASPYGSGQPGSMSMTGQNPYLQQMGDALTKTMTNNWQRNVQPQIASSAMATGGYGGSRQGVMEANSANDLNQGIGSALAGLYGNGYNTSLQYDLGVKNNQLGFGNLGLGYANLDRNINNDNNNWQLQGANFGMGVYNQMQQNNQAGIQSGTNIQNTPMNYWSQFGNQANSFGQGYGTTTGNTSQQGSPIMGALGGAQLGQQVGNWWSGGTAGSAGDTATGQNFWAPNFSGGMGD